MSTPSAISPDPDTEETTSTDLPPEPETAPTTTEDVEPTDQAPEETQPEASAPKKFSAFERGKLIALGMGKIIGRLETAEGQLTAALGKIKLLEAENARLIAGSEANKQQIETQLAEAKQGRENEVSLKVRETLSALGVPEDKAPAATDSEQKQLTIVEFNKLSYEGRNQFIRQGGKIID